MTDITLLIRLYRKMFLITLNRWKTFQDILFYINTHLFIYFEVCFNQVLNLLKSQSYTRTNWCFIFQFTVPSITRKIIQYLLISSSLSSRHFYSSFYIPFNNAFQKTVPMQDFTNRVSLYLFRWVIPVVLISVLK